MGTKNKPGKYDCYANAHPDEPMFILLGRDPFAPDLVEEWARRRQNERGPSEKVSEALACAAAMREWQKSRTTNGVRIVVNGEHREVSPEPLAYEEVVKLAGMTGTPSLTWRLSTAGGGLSSGIMYPGSFRIVPSEGMVFNVAHTGNA